ncbi:hypothetical protein DH2020_015908 [Rehmannia glutinosa]|uniref:Uncharacterized protein n=1 Tax=Rehmannia glutinosa TaxID=99300 RepID=A0ABR0WWK0_REHGL
MALNLPTFNTLNIRLDRSNYNFWRSQILATATAYGFEEFLFGSASSPSQFIVDDSSGKKATNPEYVIWLRKDKFLFSWMLNSISDSMLGYVNRCSTSCEIWNLLENLFRTQSQARVMHLKSLLQNLKKEDLSISEYILKMQSIADDIQAAGKTVDDDDLMIYILHGLGPEYESVVVNLTTRKDLTLSEMQYTLQTHEMRLQHMNSILPGSNNNTNISLNMAAKKSFPEFRTPRGGFNGRYRGRGRSFRGSRVICQICGRNNHTAAKCYKRFDVNFSGLEQTVPTPPTNPTSFHQAHLATMNYSAPTSPQISQSSSITPFTASDSAPPGFYNSPQAHPCTLQSFCQSVLSSSLHYFCCKHFFQFL